MEVAPSLEWNIIILAYQTYLVVQSLSKCSDYKMLNETNKQKNICIWLYQLLLHPLIRIQSSFTCFNPLALKLSPTSLMTYHC